MSEAEPMPPTQDQLMQEAATWFARMRGPEAEASREDFEAWLKRGALHRQAYNRASEIFAMGKVLAGDVAPPGPAPDGRGQARGWRNVAWAVGALLALIATGFLVLGSFGPDADQRNLIADRRGSLPPAESFSTTTGQPRMLRLADGSIISLEPDSQVDVRLGTSERHLELLRGRARFQVFHEARPFVVHAGGGQVIARGTIFVVGYGAGRRVNVRLIEGSVDVVFPASQGQRPAGPSRRLRPGQALSYGPAQDAARAAPEAQSGIARPADRPGGGVPTVRDFEGILLADLVAAANRGTRRPIRLADPSIDTLRVSGRFSIDDTELLAERLTMLFGLVRADDQSGDIVLRRR